MPEFSVSTVPLEVHGHRGCRGLLPENTLPAFLHALALGVDVLEMDVVISADMQVVVSHEPWLNPLICRGPDGEQMAPETPPRFNLYQMPYQRIRVCNCGLLRHPDFPGQHVQAATKPLLREVLATVEASCQQLRRAPVWYAIEVKSSPVGDGYYHPGPATFLALVMAEIAVAQVQARTHLLSFDQRVLQVAHRQFPALATCLLIEDDLAWPRHIQALGFVPATLGPHFSTVTPLAAQELRSRFPGLRLVPWTVNTLVDMARLRKLGVDGLTTDYPDRLLNLLRE